MTHNPVSDSLSEPLLQGGEEPQLGHTVVQVSATAATSNGTAHPTGTIQKTLQRKGSGDSDGRQAESLSVSVRRCSTLQTTAALLTLQLGWGLWLLPCDFARLGWVFGIVVLALLAIATSYSGSLFTRLYGAVPQAVLFGDVGDAAAGRVGRISVYITIYSLDATRCIILHLAATQSLFHALSPSLQQVLPLWQCSVIVAVVVLLLGQIRYLTQLSWFFMTGTAAQLVAIAIVVYDMLLYRGSPGEGGDASDAALHLGATLTAERHQELVYDSPLFPSDVSTSNWTPAAMAVLNMIFAYGGQFAFLEIMSSMRTPNNFSKAVMMCTGIMTALYGGFGAIGYWSKGASVHGIAVFSMRAGVLAQIAAAFIFFQALAQYLVNLNVWTHNLLVLSSRRSKRPSNSGELWDEDNSRAGHMSTGDHSSGHWLAATAFVAAYSAVIAVAVPFFCTLVGLVTSVTYLTTAYTLPAIFALKLFPNMNTVEKWWLKALIPISIILSLIGFVASIKTYMIEASGGEGM
ncbi:hypothetical protein CHLRE_06g298750v5 [Chlamydomonas reinhardtii]|uniref:Amino acid transporter transmembrane domain-containing protein n=1 Tax=Chlamydomonas reinhardtii TaxID=3055 RepID=A8IP12_CHLRE|nr:uncharacterized protein CHLRE_06g298750v5 [Chlamydomonas reinhardtii]PNW82897.1 hypothetical protein CHLRE_06g298750v5 [Chlamydomonas reinhardtii]|eukprot:XP_001691450.1 amino acid transporter [Chlamydomonas reinhardtii]